MANYLVFESQQPADTTGAPYTQFPGREPYQSGPAPLFGYNCVGAVRAKDSMEAVKAIMSRTRRIGKYAVIEAEFIDFAAATFQDPDSDAPVLNP